MNYFEMKQAVKMLHTEWNLGKRESLAKTDICAWIYLIGILEESEKIVLYKEKGKLIGFCGYSKYNSNKYKLRKKFYSVIKKRLYKSSDIKNLEALKRYEENYSYTPHELENYFDGEISILIVDKKYRKRGIGKKLLNKVFDIARDDNLKNLQILSDESCSYQFYEMCGCKKIYETIIENEEEGRVGMKCKEKAFIYEKKLN